MSENLYDSFLRYSRALPDTITQQQVDSSINLLTEVAASDPEVVANTRLNLLDRLEGLAEAVSAIVLSQGTVETTDLSSAISELPRDIPLVWNSNVYRRYRPIHGAPQQGHLMFEARPAIGAQAPLSVEFVCENPARRLTRYSTNLPVIGLIDKIRQSATWQEVSIVAADHRAREETRTHYPFHNSFGLVDSTVRYFDITQELITDFLGSINGNGFTDKK